MVVVVVVVVLAGAVAAAPLLHPESPVIPMPKATSTSSERPIRARLPRERRVRRFRVSPASSTPAITEARGAPGLLLPGTRRAPFRAIAVAGFFARIVVPEAQLEAFVVMVSVLAAAVVPDTVAAPSE